MNVKPTPGGIRFELLEGRILLAAFPEFLYEPNNTPAEATDLGIVGYRRRESMVSSDTDPDWYTFVPAVNTEVTARIDIRQIVPFPPYYPNMQLSLYSDLARPPVVGSGGAGFREIYYAVGGGHRYYLAVNGSSTMNVYTLTLSCSGIGPDTLESNDDFDSSTNLEVISQHTETGLSLHEQDEDFFSFVSAGSGMAEISLQFDNVNGDIDLYLYDASQTELAHSTSRTTVESVSYSLVGGEKYFVVVTSDLGDTNPSYELTIDAPPIPADAFEPNDYFDSAADLRWLGPSLHSGLTVHAPFNSDYFKFAAAVSGELEMDLLFTNDNGDLQLALYDAPAPTAVVAWSFSHTDNEHITYSVEAGHTYYVLVYGYYGAINPVYTLDIDGPVVDRFEPNDRLAHGVEMGTLSWTCERFLTLYPADDPDYYRFTAGRSGRMDVKIEFSHIDGDLRLGFMQTNGALLGMANTGTDDELVGGMVTAGQTYAVEVSGYLGASNLHYDLLILPPGDADFNGLVDLSDLGILAANWGRTTATGPEQGDFSSDGNTDLSDLGILATWWGTGTQALAGTMQSASAESLAAASTAQYPLEAANPLAVDEIDRPTASPVSTADVAPWRYTSRNQYRHRLPGSESLRWRASLNAAIRHTATLEVLDALALSPMGRAM